MHRYETLFIVHSELPEAQVRETVDRIRRLIESMGGEVTELQDWGMRDLAYPIRKQPRGVYVLVQYTARPEVVKELQRAMKLSDEILRFVSVRMPETRTTGRRVQRPRPAPALEETSATEEEV
jgi:small subunit ribosomal protein S6